MNKVNLVNFSDIVEENGKTINENNLEKVHKIPVGTLVDVPVGDNDDILRVYVAEHSRDCDGTPLYRFSINHDVAELLEKEKKDLNGRVNNLIIELESNIFGNHPEESISIATNKIEINTVVRGGEIVSFKNKIGDVVSAYLIKKVGYLMVVSFNKEVREEIETIENSIRNFKRKHSDEDIKNNSELNTEWRFMNYLLIKARAEMTNIFIN